MRIALPLLFTTFLISPAHAEELQPFHAYIDLGEFVVNLKKDRVAKFTAQLYVTSSTMETALKIHQPRIKGMILSHFSMQSAKKLQKVKKRKKLIRKLTKKIRKTIPSYDFPEPVEPEPPFDPNDFKELLITSLIYR